jgi:hypothetical protein
MDNVQINQQVDDDFYESPITQNGEAVMMLARGVGLLVAIVAVLMWFMLMMLVRACLAWLVHIWGVSGVGLLVALFVLGAMRYGHMPSAKLIWIMFRHSCS